MSQNKEIEPFDDNPPLEHIQRMAQSFNKTKIQTSTNMWLNDKSKDFYLGMYAALRICISGVNTLKNTPEMSLDDLELELMIFNGQIANKILER